MTETATALQASRVAHQQAKSALRAGHQATARALFRDALVARMAAHKTDPEHVDDDWLQDALALPCPANANGGITAGRV